MDKSLDDIEIRVLGCLLEKEMATPDYYPLSLNALINACNQKSNREPVVAYDEETVIKALDRLFDLKMARQSNISRVTKYEQIFSTKLNMVNREAAIMCILLVRGPQTAGEIRSRTERLYAFKNLDEVHETISNLEDIGLIGRLPRLPGRKESRYAHLLGGTSQEPNNQDVQQPERSHQEQSEKNNCIDDLQKQIDLLREEVQQLQMNFETFKSQFD